MWWCVVVLTVSVLKTSSLMRFIMLQTIRILTLYFITIDFCANTLSYLLLWINSQSIVKYPLEKESTKIYSYLGVDWYTHKSPSKAVKYGTRFFKVRKDGIAHILWNLLLWFFLIFFCKWALCLCFIYCVWKNNTSDHMWDESFVIVFGGGVPIFVLRWCKIQYSCAALM